MSLILPVAVDQSNPVQSPLSDVSYQVQGPWTYNGKLYLLCHTQANQPGPPALFSGIYRSADGGSSWSGPLDAGNQPAVSIAVGNIDRPQSIIAVAFVSDDSGADVPIYLQNFNLETETWLAVHGTSGAPEGYRVNALFVRPDASYLVIYLKASGLPQNLKYFAPVVAGAWGASLQLDSNRSPDGGATSSYSSVSSVIDSSGRLHCFTTEPAGFSGLPWYILYQQILPDNTLGAWNRFSDADSSDLNVGVGLPAVVNDELILPYRVFPGPYASAYIGIDLSNPAWSFLGVPIDPDATVDSTLLQTGVDGIPGACIVFAGVLYYVYVAQTADAVFPSGRVRLLITIDPNPAAGWSGETILDLTTCDPAFIAVGGFQEIYQVGLSSLPSLILNAFNPALDPGVGNTGEVFSLPVSVPPAVIGAVRITFRGVKRMRDCGPQLAAIPELPHVE